MRFNLPWFDVNYFYDSDLKTPSDKKVKKLNDFLEKNRIKWWIKLLNDGAVLEIDDSVSWEKLEKIKWIALELLKTMWATESQLVDAFSGEICEKNNDMQPSNIVERKLEEYDVGSLIWEIKDLNPEVKIEADYDRWIIYSSIGIDELVLPEWFYYNEKNGITNKHNTKTWIYVSVLVKPIEKYNPDYL